MPELPEVDALVADLRRRLDGRAIVTVHVPQFSALKTFDPPLHALEGTLVDGSPGTGSSSTSRRPDCTW